MVRMGDLVLREPPEVGVSNVGTSVVLAHVIFIRPYLAVCPEKHLLADQGTTAINGADSTVTLCESRLQL